MFFILLLIIVLIIYKNLFNTFGSVDKNDLMERDELLKQLEKMAKDPNSNVKIKKVCIVADEKGNAEIIPDKDDFVKTSKTVVEYVNNALSNNDFAMLSKLLSPNLYSIFEKRIKENIENKYFLKSVVVSFDKAEVLDFVVNEGKMLVNFVINEINYIEDENHNLIKGDRSQSVKVNELWEFIKNKNNSEDTPWLINSIKDNNE